MYKTLYEPYQIDVNIFCPCCAQPQVCGSAVRWGRVPSNGGCTRPAAQKPPENPDGDSHTYPSHSPVAFQIIKSTFSLDFILRKHTLGYVAASDADKSMYPCTQGALDCALKSGLLSEFLLLCPIKTKTSAKRSLHSMKAYAKHLTCCMSATALNHYNYENTARVSFFLGNKSRTCTSDR